MDLTQEQISKIFELASMKEKAESGDITTNDITQALIEIERKIYSFGTGIKLESIEDKKILIADDLELSIYQLSTVLKRIGVVPKVARDKDEAMQELQKAHFDCVIIDLFMPNSSDGFELVETAVKRRKELAKDIKIIVISGTDDSSLIEHCYELGIDFYIQKDKDWHAKLLKFLSTTFQTENNIAFTRYIINNNIVSYIIKRFNEPKIFDAIIKNINSAIYTGINNVLFDLKDITTFDTENAYVFADIYKICAENGGKFVLINPSSNIKEALAFAYLEDVIPCKTTVEDAVDVIASCKSSQ